MIKISLQIKRVSDRINPNDSPIARALYGDTTKSIISINDANVETREQAADILQSIVDSLRAG